MPVEQVSGFWNMSATSEKYLQSFDKLGAFLGIATAYLSPSFTCSALVVLWLFEHASFPENTQTTHCVLHKITLCIVRFGCYN